VGGGGGEKWSWNYTKKKRKREVRKTQHWERKGKRESTEKSNGKVLKSLEGGEGGGRAEAVPAKKSNKTGGEPTTTLLMKKEEVFVCRLQFGEKTLKFQYIQKERKRGSRASVPRFLAEKKGGWGVTHTRKEGEG